MECFLSFLSGVGYIFLIMIAVAAWIDTIYHWSIWGRVAVFPGIVKFSYAIFCSLLVWWLW